MRHGQEAPDGHLPGSMVYMLRHVMARINTLRAAMDPGEDPVEEEEEEEQEDDEEEEEEEGEEEEEEEEEGEEEEESPASGSDPDDDDDDEVRYIVCSVRRVACFNSLVFHWPRFFLTHDHTAPLTGIVGPARSCSRGASCLMIQEVMRKSRK